MLNPKILNSLDPKQRIRTCESEDAELAGCTWNQRRDTVMLGYLLDLNIKDMYPIYGVIWYS